MRNCRRPDLEAVTAAALYKTDNLVAIVDHNKMHATGKIPEACTIVGAVALKFASFGWRVLEVDGHDLGGCGGGLG